MMFSGNDDDTEDLPAVEMRPAMEWTCDTCGRDNFCRVTSIEPTPDDKDSMIEEFIAHNDLEGGIFTEEEIEGIISSMHVQAIPKKVKCPHCSAMFRVEVAGTTDLEDY